jgi:hypothetical protein
MASPFSLDMEDGRLVYVFMIVDTAPRTSGIISYMVFDLRSLLDVRGRF